MKHTSSAQFKSTSDVRSVMCNLSRLKVLAVCVGAALAQVAASDALADSAVGVDTALGNALNPPGRSAVPRPLADDGYDTVRHSPSGQLYGVPIDNSGETSKTEGGWLYSGGVEGGVLGGDAGLKNAKFREYKDLKNGLYLNYFEVEADKPDSANFIQALGAGTGRDDQFYGTQFGRYNDWKVKLFYNETSHVFTDTWKSLYNGEGSGNLTLKIAQPKINTGSVGCTTAAPCWDYGGVTYPNAGVVAAVNGVATQTNLSAAIKNTLAGTDYSELSLVRKKGGARFDIVLDDYWKGYASYSEERRTGARPFAMNNNNLSTEIAEPIDYATRDLLAGLQYADKLTQANLRASLSMFHNNISTLTVQYPWLSNVATGLGAVQNGTFDLNPDNKAFNLKGEVARKLPDFYNGRINAAIAIGSNRQDDSLLAPLNNASGVPSMNQNGVAAGAGYGTAVGTYGFDPSKWNTTAALSQQTAKQRLDTRMYDFGLTLNPIDDLSVKGNLHRYETINKANDGNGHQYTAYNPLTGQFGYIKYDNSVGTVVGSTGGLGSPCYTPPGFTPVAGCYFNGPTALTAAQAGATLYGMPAAAWAANNPSGTPVYSLARDYKQDIYSLSADYDLGHRSSVEGLLEREDFTRHMREREKTWEDKLKLGYVNRDFDIATLRASIEADRRRGGEYNAGLLANVPYYQQVAYALALPGNSLSQILGSVGSPGYPATLALVSSSYVSRFTAQGRKTDLADRDQNILNGRLNFNPREDLDFGVMLQLKNAKYPETVYGAEKDNLNSLNFDANYQPSPAQQVTAYYSRQDGLKKTTGNASGGTCTGFTTVSSYLANCAMTNTTGNATLGTYLSTSVWNMTTKDINDVIGLSFQQDIGNTKLAIDYTFAQGRTKIGYDYGSTAVSPVVAAAEVALGNAMPDMTTVQHTLMANLLVPIEKNLSARLMYRYESFRVKDWHYDGVIAGQVLNIDGGTLLLDAGPQNYHANVIGVFFQYKL